VIGSRTLVDALRARRSGRAFASFLPRIAALWALLLFVGGCASDRDADGTSTSGEARPQASGDRAEAASGAEETSQPESLSEVLAQWREDGSKDRSVEAFVRLHNAPISRLRLSDLTEAEFRALHAEERRQRSASLIDRSEAWRALVTTVLDEASEAAAAGKRERAEHALAGVRRTVEANSGPEALDIARITADAVARMADRFAAEHPELADEQDGA